MTGGCLTKYQAILLDAPEIILKVCQMINPAELMPGPDYSVQDLEHTCSEVIGQVYSSRPDLLDSSIDNADDTWFIDGSSFIEQGTCKGGYAVVNALHIIETQALAANMSTQKAKLIALTQALHLAKDMVINIYTDSKYAFLVLHAHGAIWKERGLLNTKNSPIKHGAEILALLNSVLLPKQVAVVHCWGHQKDLSLESQGNNFADWEAKQAAKQSTLFKLTPHSPCFRPYYSYLYKSRNNPGSRKGYTQETKQSWQINDQGKIFIPKSLQWKLVNRIHQATHFGKQSLTQLLSKSFDGHTFHATIRQVCHSCSTCAQVNPEGAAKPPPLLWPVQR
nr:PREDICTED: uncharacterized protein LOC103567627 [Equus przewalskii]XP_023504482.1 uncharacterized protein LOC111774979 [Equus caballus]